MDDILPYCGRSSPGSRLVVVLVVGALLAGTLPTAGAASPGVGIVGENDTTTILDDTGVLGGSTVETLETLETAETDDTFETAETLDTTETLETTNTTETLETVAGTDDGSVVSELANASGSGEVRATVSAPDSTGNAPGAGELTGGVVDGHVSASTSGGTVVATVDGTAVGVTLDGEITVAVGGLGLTDGGTRDRSAGAGAPRLETADHGADISTDDTGASQRGQSEPTSGGSENPASVGSVETETGTQSDSPGPLPDAPGPLPAVLGIGGLGAILFTSSRFTDGLGAIVARDWVGASLKGRLAGWLGHLRPLLGLAGYQRYEGDDPLEHVTRATVFERIESEPGIYLAALSEATGLPMGTVRYHLKILEFEGLVNRSPRNGRRRYYPIDVDPAVWETLLENSAARAVLSELATGGPTSVGDLADSVDRDPSTITHHTTRLAEMGLVERTREGRSTLNRLTEEGRAAVPTRPPAQANEQVGAPSRGHSAGD